MAYEAVDFGKARILKRFRLIKGDFQNPHKEMFGPAMKARQDSAYLQGLKKIKRKILLKRLLQLTGIGIALFILLILLIYWGVFGPVPGKDDILSFEQYKASEVLSDDGSLIGKIYVEDRTDLKLDELPEYVIHALIATEDARYYEHEGLDSRSLLRVLFKTILLNMDAGGGSTITQQLAKNMYGRKNFSVLTTPVAKIREVIVARRLEEVLDKDQILELYLNQVPFGENSYGVESAALRFFNKRAKDLKIEEAAVLVGMLKANTAFNPRLHPESSLNRRNVVISQMYRYDYISERERDSLRELPLVLDYANMSAKGPANYFLVQVKNEAEKILEDINEKEGSEYSIRKDGLVIKTTLSLQSQKAALDAFERHLKPMQDYLRQSYFKWNRKTLDKLVNLELKKLDLESRADEVKMTDVFSWDGFYTDSISVRDSVALSVTMLHAGLIALDPSNGAIKTWVGGIDFRTQPYDQILAKRQMASAFKPMLYAAALQDGVDPCIRLENDSIILIDNGKPWSPENYDKSYTGTYSMAGALSKSMNIPTVNLYFEVGFERLFNTWRDLGFTSRLQDKPVSALGIADASLYEAAIAYSCFANGGYRVKPYTVESIETSDGTLLYKKSRSARQQVLTERTAALISAMLQKAVREGTGTALHSKYGVNLPLAGKTGTSQDFADAWFAAYNPGLVMISRVGASSARVHFYSGTGSGSRLALPLVGLTLNKIQYGSTGKKWRKEFPELKEEWIEEMDCPDYLEDSLLQQWLDFLKDGISDEEKEERKEMRKEKIRDFFKDVLGTKDSKEE